MKKILAILMALVMLLSACAFAEAAEASGAEIVLGDVVVLEGETPILDLTGIDLRIGVYDGENTGLKLGLGAQGAEVVQLAVALGEEKILLSLTGVSDVYYLDQAMVSEAVTANVTPVINVDEVSEEIKPEDMMALSAVAMEAMGVIMAGIVPAGPQEIEGVTYDVVDIEIPAEELMPIVEKAVKILDNYSHLLEDSDIESFSQLYDELKPALGASGVVLTEGNSVIFDLDLNGSLNDGATAGTLNIFVDGGLTDDGNMESYIELTVSSGEISYALGLNLGLNMAVDGSWLPASDAPVDLIAALEDEAQSQQLMLQAMSAGMMALSQMASANETVAALMGSMMAG